MQHEWYIEIALPRDEVVKAFVDTSSLQKWQSDLLSIDVLEGKPGEEGYSTKLKYQRRDSRGTLEVVRKITASDLPNSIEGVLIGKGAQENFRHTFRELTPTRTQWHCECSYELESLLMRLIGKLIPHNFKIRTLRQMLRFQHFVEGRNKPEESSKESKAEEPKADA